MNSAPPLSLSDEQIFEVLRHARQIEDDVNRDEYFRVVADALHAIPDFCDDDVRNVCSAAFRPFLLREPTT
jgi:hypothetical protein